MTRPPLPGIVVVLGAILPAQSFTVSPPYATAAEGNSADATLWESPTHRFQQIHNDLRGQGFTVSAISFRRDGLIAMNPHARARTIDAEVLAGHGDYASATGTFASNYLDAPTPVVNRTSINLPDLTANQGSPAPWSIVIPFDRQWRYDGQRDLLWEIRVYANTALTNYALDAHAGINVARHRNIGTGCTANGKTQPMTLNPGLVSSVDEFSFQWSGANFPASAPAFVIIDGVDVSLSLPFLCTTLHAAPWVQLIPGTTSSGGIFQINPRRIPMNSSWGGISLFQQGLAIDAGRPDAQFVLTHGVASVLGMQPDTSRVTQVWTFSPTAPVGIRRAWYPSSFVIRFSQP